MLHAPVVGAAAGAALGAGPGVEAGAAGLSELWPCPAEAAAVPSPEENPPRPPRPLPRPRSPRPELPLLFGPPRGLCWPSAGLPF